ncbi:hypothetical protein [Nocardiopsis metallicus]|uniref:Uncharacterized protein n=1 Tax=Nocardiopsis metallicus TaxID=179819 RepID=A0A840WH01_9ACTN|nr:hypothetical protein [Nocardiopsis metallicus]MBB5494743.1 hypothetical protein [Nocardiopsis metallicus]
MGSGGSQTHALYTTAPTVHEEVTSELGLDVDQVVDLVQEQEAQPSEVEPAEGLGEAAAEHLEKFHQLFDEIKALQEGPDHFAMIESSDEDPELDWYKKLQHTTNLASHHLINAVGQGFPGDQAEELNDLKGKATAEALAGLSDQQLQKIAKGQGFLYPELVGINHAPGANHALVHWLDPHYFSDLDSKTKIQAKAQERFTQLCAGQTVAGKTLADVDHSGYGSSTWTVSQEQYTAMCSTLNQQAEAFTSLPAEERAQSLAQMIDAENKIFTAKIPWIQSESLSGSKAEATVKVDEVLAGLPPNTPDVKIALEAAQKQGHIPAVQRQFLADMAALQLARASVPQSEKDELLKVADHRFAQFTVAKHWHDTLMAPGGLISFTDDGKLAVSSAEGGKASADDIVNVAQAAQKYFAAQKDVSEWILQTSDAPNMYKQISGTEAHNGPLTPEDLSKKFKAWAVSQDKHAMIQAAQTLGMTGGKAPAKLSKTYAKMHIAAVWFKGAGVSPPSTGPAAPSTAKKASASTPSPAPTASAFPSTKTSVVAKTSFGGHHAKLLDALKHYSGAAVDVPKPVDAKAVATHDFGSGTSATGLGGVHSKSLHTGPDGGQWMFKPDKKTGGARAAAEAAASQIFQAAGVSAVPVYTAKVGGHTGAVQPMVKGASALPSEPKAWTQADVDHMVRAHVAQWVFGDHDSHPGNILKTPSGGLVPIDAGQAFKHYGTDKLSLDYHPNASFGAPRPAYQQAYQAAAKGGLADGVKIKPAVAHPVIKQLESIPDSQWRAMLHATAHQGAKNSQIGWVPHMRKRAATKHKIPASKVTSDQIAEAFLDHACERKNGLRQAFTSFFSKELNLPGADVLKYGG